MLVCADGGYESASDYDEETLALIARDEAPAEQDMELMGSEAADQYMSLVAQRALSVQLSPTEYNQRHNLFQTKEW